YIDEVFFSVDMKEYRVLQMSQACEKMYGYTQAEFKGNINLWKEVIHPDDKYIIKSNDDKLLKGKMVFNQYRIIHKNKSIRWIEGKIIPTLDEEGKLIKVEGIVRDITERKNAQEKVIQTERLLSESQELAKMGNWNADFINNEIFWSQGLRKIHGVSADFPASFIAFIGLIHPEDRDNVYKRITDTEEKGRSLEIEYRIIRADNGKTSIIHMLLHTIKNEEGKLIRVYGISKDVTERKIAEAKVEQLNMLIYQMSHDLRGPINSAKNYIYLASVKVNDTVALDYIDKIHRSYRKIEEQLMSLLNLQRVNRSETIIEKSDLKDITEQIMRSLDNIPALSKVKVSTDITIDGDFYSDKQYLHSIIYNLFNNAIKFRSNSPDSFIKINAQNTDTGITITMEDNGIGMNEEVRSKVFDMFFKGDANANGSGLGMYIVKSLVERLKGTIQVQSEPLRGSMFTIQLPNNMAEAQ
ncbi:MAG TPA: PAS domain-containing protein, partial [Bacteroidia bacterium]|nr:PAS domain-containing protein [Bacteroidia bacterium]